MNQILKNEAIFRLKKLKVDKIIIDNFEFKDVVMCSYPNGFVGELSDFQKSIVKDVEIRGGVCYHCLESLLNSRKLFICLYVSNFEDEWKQDRLDIEKDILFTYVYDYTQPELSKFKTLKIINKNGSLVLSV